MIQALNNDVRILGNKDGIIILPNSLFQTQCERGNIHSIECCAHVHFSQYFSKFKVDPTIANHVP